jgi:hypothetical protein
MSRARARYTESDVRRILSAAAKANVSVCVEIATDGKITVVTKPSGEAAGNTTNEWDKVLPGAATDKERAS